MVKHRLFDDAWYSIGNRYYNSLRQEGYLNHLMHCCIIVNSGLSAMLNYRKYNYMVYLNTSFKSHANCNYYSVDRANLQIVNTYQALKLYWVHRGQPIYTRSGGVITEFSQYNISSL